MKILILCDVLFPQTVGGAGRVARELGVAWAQTGDSIQYLTRDTSHQSGVRVSPVQDNGDVTYYPPLGEGLGWRFREIFRSVVARFNPDIVHVHQPLPAFLSIPRSFSGPLVYTFHSSWPEELKIKYSRWPLGVRKLLAFLPARVEKRVVDRAAAITVLSRFSQGEVARLYRREATVIPGGVDSERFRPGSDRVAGVRVRLVTVRNLVPRMGLRALIRAMVLLPATLRLDIGGHGPLRGELDGLVRSLGLDDRVKLCGAIADEALPRFYASADWFVLPTQALEGFGLVILESLACGTPVLGTRVAAIPELLERFNPAWVIAAPTPEAIAVTVRSAMGQAPPVREELHRRVAAEFDWKRQIAPRYRHLFESLR